VHMDRNTRLQRIFEAGNSIPRSDDLGGVALGSCPSSVLSRLNTAHEPSALWGRHPPQSVWRLSFGL
jgi:hypothetical protein